MKRFLSGSVLLALTAVFSACSSDSGPTQDGTPDHIVATPSVAFVKLGDSTAILLRLVDQQGTSLLDPVTISNVQGGINVRPDSAFRPIYTTSDSLIFNPNGTEIRVYVRGDGLSAGSFDVSAGGKTATVPVTVTPVVMDVTSSSPAPDVGGVDTLTITSAGLTFTATSDIVDAAGTSLARVLGLSADGTQAYIMPTAAGVTAYSVSNVVPTYAPSLNVTLPVSSPLNTSASVLAQAVTVGTPFTSNFPVVGTFWDFGDGTWGQFYTVTVPAAGNYKFTMTSSEPGNDIGLYFASSTGALGGVIADAKGDGATAEPEVGTKALVAGVNYFTALYFDYGGEPVPAQVTVTVEAVP